ncbi:MAG: serine hydrolase [Chthoniobacterales bacterium]
MTHFRRLFFALSIAVTFAPPLFAAPDKAPAEAQVRAAIEKLKKMTQQEMEKTGVPGVAIAVVYKDALIYAEGFGVRQIGEPEKVDPDTVFQLASVSKPIGATVVAGIIGNAKNAAYKNSRIAENGWDTRIRNLDPAFEMHAPWVSEAVTLRDFYSHRTGLPDHAGDHLEDIGFTREEILQRLYLFPPSSSFRSGYAYTNFGLTEAAVAAAASTGKSWEEISDEVLYKPLGMASTSSRYEDFISRKNRASGHARIDGKWVAKFHRDPDAQSPAGGVSSSVNDLANWMLLQIHNGKFKDKQVIADEPLTETHRPVILTGFNPINGVPGFYGLGWGVNYDDHGRLRLSHSGAFELGAATCVTIYPEQQLGIIVLSNASPVGLPETLCANFADLALDGKLAADWSEIFGKIFAAMSEAEDEGISDFSKPPASPIPSEKNSAYIGTYSNPIYGDIEIRENEEKLELLLGPKKAVCPLTHWDRDTFYLESGNESFIGKSGAFFLLDAENKAHSVLLEVLNQDGLGTFTRKAAPTTAPAQ